MAGKSNEQKTFMDIFKDPIALDEFLQAQCKANTEDPFADFNCDTSKAKAKTESDSQKEAPASAGSSATFEDRLPDGPMFFMQQNVNINNERASTTSRQQKGMHSSTESHQNGMIKTNSPSGSGSNTTVLSQMIGAQTNINVIVNQTIFDRNQQKAADVRTVATFDNRRQAKSSPVAPPPPPRMEAPTPKRKQRAANVTLQHLMGQNAPPSANPKRQRNSTRRTAKTADQSAHQLPIVGNQTREVYNPQRQSIQALMMLASSDQLDNHGSALNHQQPDQKRTADIPIEYLWPLLQQSVRPATLVKEQQPLFLVRPQLSQRQPLPRLPNVVTKQRQCRPIVREHNFTADERIRLAQHRALKNYQIPPMQIRGSQPSYPAVPSYLRAENGVRLTEPMQAFTAQSLNRIPPIPVQQCARISPDLCRTVNVLYGADPQIDANKVQTRPLSEKCFRPQTVVPQMQQHRLPRQLVPIGPFQCKSEPRLLPPVVKRNVHFQDEYLQPAAQPAQRLKSLAQVKQEQEEVKRLAMEREKAEQLRREEELRKRLERDKYLYEHPDLETPFSNYNDIAERLTPFVTMAPKDDGDSVCSSQNTQGIDLASEVDKLKYKCHRIVNSKSKTLSTPKDSADRLLVSNLLLELERQNLADLRRAPPALPEHVLKLRGRNDHLPVHCRFHVDGVERRKTTHSAAPYTEGCLPLMPNAAPSEYGSDEDSANPLRGLPPL